MKTRTIIIGDVHGCHAELEELLRGISASPRDRLISVGDLIGKGPDSRSVLEWAMKTPNLECVQGNHEFRFLKFWRRSIVPDEKPYDLETFRQMGGRFDYYMRFIDHWPLYVQRDDLLVVHAGFDPRLPLERQPPELLVNARRGSRTPASLGTRGTSGANWSCSAIGRAASLWCAATSSASTPAASTAGIFRR